ncbi:hypothetical protein AVT42_gp33 [Polaribacter phage P12002S]|uniref:Uncharacterized protein n=1 Tax=Polaribacter phage P12002S TaxID=1647387 RepID=A0A0F7IKL3_9CAUD|nr:hypothetical protein AVT42_gp33 [Polaribacter phage P12002S]AKG94289.1 hypothetical protein P12002S_0033 [Polaribacter phage P12002S]
MLLNSCGAKKTVTEYKEKIVKDSIYITKDRFITKQVNDTILIKELCDTLGNLKNFDRQIHSGGTKVRLKSVNGDLKATVNIDSLVNEKVTEFKQNYEREVEIINIDVVRYKTPLWMWLTIVLEGLVIILLIRMRLF